MESVLDSLSTNARVTILRLRSLGDCVLTTPAISLLKTYRPDLRLSVVVEPRFQAIFENNPNIEQLLPPTATAVARSKPELLINLHGGTTSILLTLASRARLRAGFGHYRAQAAYNVRIPRTQEILGVDRKVHTAEHLASAMFYLGVPHQEIPRAQLFPKVITRPAPYAILHPFASTPAKTWPADRFEAIAHNLKFANRAATVMERYRSAQSTGIQPLLLCGPADDPSTVPGVEPLTGLSLSESMALIQGASLFIGNDSGPAHIAAACATPLVVLFAASDAIIWAPWKAPESVQIVRDHISDITVDEVLSALAAIGVRA